MSRVTTFRVFSLSLLVSTMTPASIADAQQTPPPAPPPLSDETKAKPGQTDATRAVAQMLRVSPAEASERLALQEEASRWASTLVEQNAAGFVDIELRHEPNFKVEIFYNGSIDRELLQRNAPVSLRRYLVFRPVKRDKSQVAGDTAQVVEALRRAKVRFGAFYSLADDKVVVEIPDLSLRGQAEEALPPALRSDVLIRQGNVAHDSGGIYGGNWYRAGGPSGGICTAGWPIRDSGGQAAILTAGHCVPRNAYFPYIDSGAYLYLSDPYAWRKEIYYGKTYDYAMYRLGVNTTSPAIYLQNNTSMPDGSVNTVPGFVSAYYAIDSVKLFSQQLVGYLTCKNGARSGFTCGRLESTSYSNATHAALARVTQSNQPYIGVDGDGGGPVFAYPNGNLVSAFGIVIATAKEDVRNPDGTIGQRDCKNTSTDNTRCFILYMPFIRATERHPFQVNTQNGFVTPS